MGNKRMILGIMLFMEILQYFFLLFIVFNAAMAFAQGAKGDKPDVGIVICGEHIKNRFYFGECIGGNEICNRTLKRM